MTKRKCIDDFFQQKRLAMVGVSRNSADYSRALFRELAGRGYDMVPVNPGVAEVEGRRCFAHMQDITPPVDGALLMTTPGVTDAVVRECAEAGVPRVWMRRGSSSAAAFCESKGMAVVADECPFMFLPNTALFHRFHGFVRKITGSYPS